MSSSALAERAALECARAEAEARAGAGEALRLHVQEHFLTPKCPRCSHAFAGFNGCFALRCAVDDSEAGVAAAWKAGFCGAAFCAWCFADCGNDAHEHVKACAHNRVAHGGYFGSVDLFDASLRDLRIRRLRAYLPTLQPPALRPSLLAALRDDLADLGIDAASDLAAWRSAVASASARTWTPRRRVCVARAAAFGNCVGGTDGDEQRFMCCCVMHVFCSQLR